MRTFVKTVFNQVIAGVANEQFNDADLNALMGSVDQLSIQVRARPTSGTGPLRVILYQSNDNKLFGQRTAFADQTLTVGTELNVFFSENGASSPMPGFIRIGVQHPSGSAPVTEVTIIVCGRARGG